MIRVISCAVCLSVCLFGSVFRWSLLCSGCATYLTDGIINNLLIACIWLDRRSLAVLIYCILYACIFVSCKYTTAHAWLGRYGPAQFMAETFVSNSTTITLN